MAKHNSFWVTSGPRLCIQEREGKRRERGARKGRERAGGRETEGKGEGMRRMSA